MLTPAYNGGIVNTGIVQQQNVVRPLVQSLGIHKKIVQKSYVYCRAKGCTKCTSPGQVHYCRNCGDTNSDHCTSDCIVIKKTVLIKGVIQRY